MRLTLAMTLGAFLLSACSFPQGELPDEPPQDGGQLWSSLGVFDASSGQTPIVATDDGDLVLLWSGLGAGEAPGVDFARWIVAAVEIGFSGSCPETHLADVRLKPAAVVFVIEHLRGDVACTDDYNPRTYVVAIDRSHLPPPPFRLGSSDAPALALEVTDDLRPAD